MKICITSTQDNKDSLVDLRFGRCQYFAIYDDEAKEFDFIPNPGIKSMQGAGITAAQEIINMKIDVVITGKLGPNAMKLLKGSDIKIYSLEKATIQEAVKSFKENNLTEVTSSVPAHFGMGGRS
ncbi:NifB/NifX family molybdenum-iron cluster-binding protein [Paramaledivibacter caminithermalis]|jgi:predicted Fe-Mo cluster-binding NifX family protein|uniref:Predicted Fe-Mo cluster-binding protein, NifX family n=1 Tax=Paramaledivibacter caminithermalis (strain DSM 15212 / CIP 107654 / DViRD3) TaxID=1121301 RepID=A0A1M6S6H5_PARC5|nr:NifB/NifX family molybdenum-iron cluster-binding protein [Paramaledivibacter caminithermalis]SHK40148.1 Predicted Fe-Mo cluster-binding protein, NifX family [Paramaledivibacter caminithermalis DSM 15212]